MISNNDCETVLRLQQLIAEEEMLWLKHFDSLTDKEAEVLILAKKMGQITNKDIRENIGLDTLQASSILRKFCKNNYLLKHGKSSNSYYLLNSCYTDNCDSLAGNDRALTGASTGNNVSSYPNNDLSTGINEPSTGINDVIIIKEVGDLSNDMLLNLQSIVASARAKGRFTPEQSKSIVLQICQKQFMSSSILKHFLNREIDTIRRKYLSPLLKEGLLELAYPKTLQHPSQAYRTTDKGLAYLQTLDDNPQQDLLI
jgi:ATP-dependent DNA helicase RecG